ncbi:MAG: type II toxin-antitoxin system RelE/ParE family toxin [Bacteroidetes bacterium]|nr:type II toxin-antitoxin system RelE/ParE family toxin [Bacteroidota bacterium]
MDLIEFCELPSFTNTFSDIATDEELLELQLELCENPQKGDLVKGTGGARKVRMRRPGRGKSGGARVIYYWQDEEGVIWLIKAYAKSVAAELTAKEKKQIAKVIDEIKGSSYEE